MPLTITRAEFEMLQNLLDQNADQHVDADELGQGTAANALVRDAAGAVFLDPVRVGREGYDVFSSSEDATQADGRIFNLRHFLQWQEYFENNGAAQEYEINAWGDAWEADIQSHADAELPPMLSILAEHAQAYETRPEDLPELDEDGYFADQFATCSIDEDADDTEDTCLSSEEPVEPLLAEPLTELQESSCLVDETDRVERYGQVGDLEADAEAGLLGEAGIAIENVNDPEIAGIATQALRDLTRAWRQTYGNTLYPGREAAAKEIAEFCDETTWLLVGLDPQEYFASLSDTDLENAYILKTLAQFLKDREFTYEANASFTDALLQHRGDCNTLSQLAQHLLQASDCQFMRAMTVPQHETLVYRTEQGEDFYLDVGTVFGPPRYYDLPVNQRSSPVIIGQEVPQMSGTLLSGNLLESFRDFRPSENWDELRAQVEYFRGLCATDSYVNQFGTLAQLAMVASRHASATAAEHDQYMQIAHAAIRDGLSLNDRDYSIWIVSARLAVYEKDWLKASADFMQAQKCKAIAGASWLAIPEFVQVHNTALSQSTLNPTSQEDTQINLMAARCLLLSAGAGGTTHYVRNLSHAQILLEAIIHYRRRVDGRTDVSAQKLLVEILLRQGHVAANSSDLASAQARYERAIQLDPESTEARVALSGIMAMQKDPVSQLDLLTEAHVLSPQDVAATAALATAILYTDPDAALELAQQAIAQEPWNVGANQTMAFVAMNRFDWSQAEEHLRVATRMDQNPFNQVLWAQSLAHQGHVNQALDILDRQIMMARIFRSHELMKFAGRTLIDVYSLSGDEKMAIDIAGGMRTSWPDDATTRANYSYILYDQGNNALALRESEQAVELAGTSDPRFRAESLSARAFALIGNRNYNAAENDLNEIMQLIPAYNYYDLGMGLVRLGQCEEALALNGGNSTSVDVGLLDEAIVRLAAHMSREKDNWSGLAGLGRAYVLRADLQFGAYRYEDLERAVIAYESVWEMHPEKRPRIACALKEVYEAMLAEPEWSWGIEQVLKNDVIREKLARLQNPDFLDVDLVSACEE